MVNMTIKPFAERAGLLLTAKLSVSEAKAFQNINLDSVSPRSTLYVTEMMQSQLAVLQLVFAWGWSLWLAYYVVLNNRITFVGEMMSTALKPAQHPN